MVDRDHETTDPQISLDSHVRKQWVLFLALISHLNHRAFPGTCVRRFYLMCFSVLDFVVFVATLLRLDLVPYSLLKL